MDNSITARETGSTNLRVGPLGHYRETNRESSGGTGPIDKPNLPAVVHHKSTEKGNLMSRNMSVEVTSGVAATEVPDDAAEDFAEAYETLAKLPVNRQVTVDFTDSPKVGNETQAQADAREARLWVRQGKAWAAAQDPPLTFVRKGDVKGNPTRVAFRIYLPKPKTEETQDVPDAE